MKIVDARVSHLRDVVNPTHTTQSQLDMLVQRLQEHEIYPRLNAMLLQHGGKIMVAPPDKSQVPILEMVIKYGRSIDLPVVEVPGKSSQCHRNVAHMWVNHAHQITKSQPGLV